MAKLFVGEMFFKKIGCAYTIDPKLISITANEYKHAFFTIRRSEICNDKGLLIDISNWLIVPHIDMGDLNALSDSSMNTIALCEQPTRIGNFEKARAYRSTAKNWGKRFHKEAFSLGGKIKCHYLEALPLSTKKSMYQIWNLTRRKFYFLVKWCPELIIAGVNEVTNSCGY